MSEAELYAVLESVMPGRVFTPLAPAGTAEPYLIYQDTAQIAQNSLCGYAGLDEVHWQLDSYARSRRDAIANMRAVKRALRTLAEQPLIENEQTIYEQDTRLNRRMVQLVTWCEPEEE